MTTAIVVSRTNISLKLVVPLKFDVEKLICSFSVIFIVSSVTWLFCFTGAWMMAFFRTLKIGEIGRFWYRFRDPPPQKNKNLGGGSKYFVLSHLLGEIIQFDWYFSDGLKPPTRKKVVNSEHLSVQWLDATGSSLHNWWFQVSTQGSSNNFRIYSFSFMSSVSCNIIQDMFVTFCFKNEITIPKKKVRMFC